MNAEDKSTINSVQKTSPAVVSIVVSKALSKIKRIPAGPFSFIVPHPDGMPQGPEQSDEKVKIGGGSGFIVKTTEAVFMASLNLTWMSLSSSTPVSPLEGSVQVMYGLGHAVQKLHGFGTGPGTSAKPALSSA